MSKNTKLNIAILLTSTVILIVCMLFIDTPSNIFNALKHAKIEWILCSLIFMIIYWLLEGLSLYVVANYLNTKLSFIEAFKISMIGQLFNCITPFASGGQPIQAYYMVKNKIHIGEASCILLAKFIIYQGILTIYSLIILIFKFKIFANTINNFAYLVFIGFILNLFIVIGLICIGIFPKFTANIVNKVIEILNKFNIIKDKQTIINNLSSEINNFYSSFKFLRTNIKILIKTSIIIIIQLTAFFIIPFTICKSLQLNINLFTVISASAFVLMISSFVPMPGASGGAEGSFYLFFGMFFKTKKIIPIAILIWRLITFYLPIFTGMIFLTMFKSRKANK